MAAVNKVLPVNNRGKIILVRKNNSKKIISNVGKDKGYFLTSPVKTVNVASVKPKEEKVIADEKIRPDVAMSEKEAAVLKGPKIHCRLCDRDITGQPCQLLFDYKENTETRLGRKINIILNSSCNYSYLSNYCCSSCTSKIQICFSLLVEIQASDEVIRQTYEHSEGAVVNTSTQTFLCEECKMTLTGIKKFIRHYESHILKKTIVGSKRDLKITEIIPVSNQKINQTIETIDLEEDDSKTETKAEEPKKIISQPVEKIIENTETDDFSPVEDNNFDEVENDQCDEIETLDDEDDNESVSIEKAVKEYDFSAEELKNLDKIDLNNVETDENIETLNDSEKEAESDAESTDTDNDYDNLVRVAKNELGKISEDEAEKEAVEEEEEESPPETKGKYVCDTCNATFEFKFLLVHHFMKDHNWLKVFEKTDKEKENEGEEKPKYNLSLKNCRYCKENFETLAHKRHIIGCKQRFFQDDREILCPDCGKMFTYKKWINHRRHHEPLPHPDGWPCELCGQRFRARRFLKSHYAKHDESKKKICEICGKKLLPLSFFSHMLKHREKRHTCQLCGKAFTYQYSLKIHMRVHDNDTRVGKPMRKQKMTCWFCREEFDGMDPLNEHLKEVHNAEGTQEDSRFPCSKCEKRFTDMFSLKAHLKLIHEMKDEEIADLKSLPVYRCIECNICKIVFNSENKVKIHLKKDHGLKPFEMEILKKECEKCGKRFASKQNLIHHINAAHLHIKPMTCDICQEKFAKHSSLIYHKLRHSGEKPFQCEFCLKSYRQRNDVIRHLARHVRDKELSLEEASALNNSPSPLVMKRRIFLKDSSINYQSVVKKSKRKVPNYKPDLDALKIMEEDEEPLQADGEALMEEGESLQYVQEENQEEQADFVTDQIQITENEMKVEYVAEDSTAEESMVYVEEVATDDFENQNVQYVAVEPMYEEDNKSTIILSSPDKNSFKNVTYRFIPSQLKYMPAVIVKKQEPL